MFTLTFPLTRRVAVIGIFVTLLIPLILFALYFKNQSTLADETQMLAAESKFDSGTDLLVEDHAVRVAVLIDTSNIRPGDSFNIRLAIGPLSVTPQERASLGNVHAGSLTPQFGAGADCSLVSAPTSLPKPTTQIAELVWDWTVSCANEGNKSLRFALTFAPSDHSTPNPSAPLYFSALRHIHVRRSISQQLLGVIATVSTLVPLLSAIALFKPTGKPSPPSEKTA